MYLCSLFMFGYLFMFRYKFEDLLILWEINGVVVGNEFNIFCCNLVLKFVVNRLIVVMLKYSSKDILDIILFIFKV